MKDPHYFPRADVVFYGLNLVPHDITSKFGIQPSRTHVRGDTRTGSSGKIWIARRGMCTFDSPTVCESSNPSDHIEAILNIFPSDYDLRNIENVEDVVLSVATTIREQPGIIGIEWNLLQRIVQLGLRIYIDAYDIREDTESS